MNETEILSEYFKQTTTDNFFDQISCESNSNSYESMSNEASRQSCAWIPSEQTRKQLIQVATSVNSPTHGMEEIKLTKPKIILQYASLTDHVSKFIKEEDRIPLLSANDVTLDDRGLRELIQAESYHAAIELTEKMLSVYNMNTSKHTLHSVQLWFTRTALLVKIGLINEAYEECKPWWNCDTPDLYLQYYPTLYGGRIGSIVPFSFRILLAELPQYIKPMQDSRSVQDSKTSQESDNMIVTLDRLYSILHVIKKIIGNLEKNLSEDGSMIELSEQDRKDSKALWTQREKRVIHSIVNCALHFKNYYLAFQVVQQLLKNPRNTLSNEEESALNSALGRILLQAGDIPTAKSFFITSKSVLEQQSSSDTSILKLQLEIDDGLQLIAESNYQLGYEKFNEILKKVENNNNYINMYILCINNLAICEFYLGKLKNSIELLEKLINHKKCINNKNYLMNLCIFYDLHGVSNYENKVKLIKLINTLKVDLTQSCLATLKIV